MKKLILIITAISLSGCYLRDNEAARPAPTKPDVMADIQHEADQHPLHNSTP